MKSLHFWSTLCMIILVYLLVFKKIKENYFNVDNLLTTMGKNIILQKEDRKCQKVFRAITDVFDENNDVLPIVNNMRLLGSKSEDENTCYLKHTDSIMKDRDCSKSNPNLYNSSFDSVVDDIYSGNERDPLVSSTIETPVCYVKMKPESNDYDVINYTSFLSKNDPELQSVLKSYKEKLSSMYSKNDYDNNFKSGFDEGTLVGKSGLYTKQQFDDNYSSGYTKGTSAGRIGLYTPGQVQESKEKGKIEAVSQVSQALKQTLDNVGWQGGGRGQGGEIWTKACAEPWNGYYKFACELNDKHSGWTDEVGPISLYNWQGPKIRVAPNGPNYCAQIGGNLKIARKRNPAHNWEDISDKVLDFTGNSVFNGKDSIFYDKYGMNC